MLQNKKCWSSINSDQRDLIHPTHLLLYTKINKWKDIFSLFDKEREIFYEKHKKESRKMGWKSDRTYLNYKSHMIRFLNYFDKTTKMDKLSEEKIVDILTIYWFK